MADVKNLMFLDLTGLGQYDAKIKSYIDVADSKSLKGLAINGNKLLAYKELPIEGATPAYEIELPETDLSGVIAKFEAATAGNVITVAEDGKTIVDSGIALANLAQKSAVEAAQTAADAAQDAVDALAALVGVIPEGYEAQTIVSYIKEVADNIIANGYDDTELQAKVTALQTAIDVLNGDDKVEGSVDYKVAMEVAKILNDNDATDIDTLEEIAAWIKNDTAGVADLNRRVTENTTAVDALEALVGTLPEGCESKTVVEYIAESLKDSNLDQYAKASDLVNAIERIAANEQAISLINTSLAEGGATYQAIVDAKAAGTNAQTAVDNLATYVGAFVADDEAVTTVCAYVDYKAAKVAADIEARLKAVEDAVATKAEQADLEALTGRVAANEGNISKNASDIAAVAETVEGIGAIPEESINGLFE